MQRTLLVAGIAVGITTFAFAQQKRVITPADLAAATPPQPRQLNWSANGNTLAYIEGGKLLVVDLSTGRPRVLLDLSTLPTSAPVKEPRPYQWKNRRVRDFTLQWIGPTEDLLVLHEGDLFRVNSNSGAFESLTQELPPVEDPMISPDGRKVAFRINYDLYCLDLVSRQLYRLTEDGSPELWNGKLDWVYPEELDLGQAVWWSPDSQHLAYLQFDVGHVLLFPHADFLELKPNYEPQRYPKAGEPNADVRVGVVPWTGGRTRWMDFGEIRDHLIARIQWLPDSKRLAAVRMNRIQNRAWLMVADIGSGDSKVFLEEQDKYWLNVPEAPLFINNEQFLWLSERSGWRHLYLYTIDGRLQRQLTSGEWEITELLEVDKKTGWIYYISTEPSPLERHLWRIDLRGNKQRLTLTPGTHRAIVHPETGRYVDIYSNFDTPPRYDLVDLTSAKRQVFWDKLSEFVAELIQLPAEIHRVKTTGNLLLYGKLIRPADFNPAKKYPAVIIVYGGPQAQLVQNTWRGLHLEQLLAQNGFVVWQLDNRGSAGRGHGFETPLYRRFGKVELEDQKRGLDYLISLGFVNSKQLGIYGWSYGGFMTLYALTHEPDLFRCGVAGAPVTDWRHYDTIYTERYLGLPDANPEGYYASSPVNFAERLKAQLLLIHNLEDDNVHFQNTARMAAALQRAGKQFQLMVYPLKTHGPEDPYRKHLYELILNFFRGCL